MKGFVATVAGLSAVGVLLISGLMHTVSPRSLREALRTHGVFPGWVTGVVSGLVGPIEFGLGAAFAAGMLGVVPRSVADAALVSAALLLWLYATYITFLARRRPGVPCGCARDDTAVGLWTSVRTAMLATLATIALLLRAHVAPDLPATQLLVATLAGLALMVVVWILPDAMAVPSNATSPARRRP